MWHIDHATCYVTLVHCLLQLTASRTFSIDTHASNDMRRLLTTLTTVVLVWTAWAEEKQKDSLEGMIERVHPIPSTHYTR